MRRLSVEVSGLQGSEDSLASPASPVAFMASSGSLLVKISKYSPLPSQPTQCVHTRCKPSKPKALHSLLRRRAFHRSLIDPLVPPVTFWSLNSRPRVPLSASILESFPTRMQKGTSLSCQKRDYCFPIKSRSAREALAVETGRKRRGSSISPLRSRVLDRPALGWS